MSFFNNLCVLTVVSVIAVAVVAEPAGPYKNIQHATYTDKELDASDRQLDVVWPVGAEGQKFPFIGFAHGFTDSGYSSYKDLFDVRLFITLYLINWYATKTAKRKNQCNRSAYTLCLLFVGW